MSDVVDLQELGGSAGEVRARLEAELSALGAHLRSRGTDWSAVQSGREWSPAQEAEHVALINEAGGRAIRLLLSDRQLRPLPHTAGVLKDGKRQAPAFAVPGAAGWPWAELEGRWADHSAGMLALAEQVQAGQAQDGQTQRTLWHPYLGEIGALDWLRSLVAHVKHHRELLERSAGA